MPDDSAEPKDETEATDSALSFEAFSAFSVVKPNTHPIIKYKYKSKIHVDYTSAHINKDKYMIDIIMYPYGDLYMLMQQSHHILLIRLHLLRHCLRSHRNSENQMEQKGEEKR